jgi:hypothetical protein
LIFACSLKIKAVCIGIVDLILLMVLFSDPERSVNASTVLGYQYQDMKKQQEQHFSVYFLENTQTLLHILQLVKASTNLNLKLLTH